MTSHEVYFVHRGDLWRTLRMIHSREIARLIPSRARKNGLEPGLFAFSPTSTAIELGHSACCSDDATSSSSQNANHAEKALLQGLVRYLPLFQDKIGARQSVSGTKDASFQVQLFPSAVREESLEPAVPPVRRRVGSDSPDAIATGDEARPRNRFATVLAQQHDCVVAILAHHAACRTTERLFSPAQPASDLLQRPPEENTLRRLLA